MRPVRQFFCRRLDRCVKRQLQDPAVLHAVRNWKQFQSDVPGVLNDVHDGALFRDIYREFLEAPDSVNLLYQISLDFFNPRGRGSRVKHSTGLITLANLNLPKHVRGKPEYLIPWALISGPREPKRHVNHHLMPLMEQFLELDKGQLHSSVVDNVIFLRMT